jgi:predicted nucleic acid-binding protein
MIVVSDTSAITALLQVRHETELREGVPFIGLLGVLVRAKQTGHIASVRKLVAELETVADFRLSNEVKAVAFRNAGEL